MNYVPGGTVVPDKEEFAGVLQRWLEDPEREVVIGQPGTYAGKALLHVHLGTERFHLNGDSRDTGVEQYLALVHRHGSDLPWHVVANQSGKVNKVAFGEPATPIRYFYLYADDQASAPYTV